MYKYMLIGFVLLISFNVYADEISQIRSIYTSVNDDITKRSVKELYLCDTDVGWVSFGDKKDKVEKCGIDGIYYEVFLKSGVVIKVKIFANTRSGDWGAFKEFYFYKNGDTAFSFFKMVTMIGYDNDRDMDLVGFPFIIEKRKYFNRVGEEIRSLSKAFSSKTKKEVPLKYLHTISLPDYETTSDMPFYNYLLQKK